MAYRNYCTIEEFTDSTHRERYRVFVENAAENPDPAVYREATDEEYAEYVAYFNALEQQ